ncbi:MAG: hypothetical protein QXW58_01325 [Thermosphaera sp.]
MGDKRAIMIERSMQRVGYSRLFLESSQELGLADYVKNVRDDPVTVLAQGDEGGLSGYLGSPVIKIRSTTCRHQDARSIAKKSETAAEVLRDKVRYYAGGTAGGLRHLTECLQAGIQKFLSEFREYREKFREFIKRTDESFKTILRNRVRCLIC